jgi:hypothetical protein
MKNGKLVLRFVLLAFVAAAIATMFLRDRTASSGQAAPAAAAAPGKPAQSGATFVAYYFHTTRRCRTCKLIEAQALETVQSRFAAELRQGRLRWEAVNIEEMGNDRYAADFGVTGSTLVMAEVKGGRPLRFEKLEQVWRFVNQKPAFVDYLQGAVASFMKGGR